MENYKLPETEDPKPFCKPLDRTEDNLDFLSIHYPKPLVAGSWYPISLAFEKTLEESAEEFMQDLHDLYDKVMCDNEDISGTNEFDNVMQQLDDLTMSAVKRMGVMERQVR